jgi:peptide chain release factor 1
VIVEVRFAEGGDDSKCFVHELAAAYVKYAEVHSLRAEQLSTSEGGVQLKFTGAGAARAFRHEPGKHCVQRVPDNEAHGRRHTSHVSVAVLPLRPEREERPLPDDEVEIKTQCGHGPGGQHQNKTASAVRATHRPTGLQVFINGRDQHSNRREALRILAARVNRLTAGAAQREYEGLRRDQHGDGRRGDKVRTYNFIGGGRVVDHRLGVKTNKIWEVMKGGFDLLFAQVEETE